MPTPKAKRKTTSPDVGVVTESSQNFLHARGKSIAKDVKPPISLSEKSLIDFDVALDNLESRSDPVPEYLWCGVKKFVSRLPDNTRSKLLTMIDDYRFTAPQLFGICEPYAKETGVHLTAWIISKHRLRIKSGSGCSCKKIVGEA